MGPGLEREIYEFISGQVEFDASLRHPIGNVESEDRNIGLTLRRTV